MSATVITADSPDLDPEFSGPKEGDLMVLVLNNDLVRLLAGNRVALDDGDPEAGRPKVWARLMTAEEALARGREADAAQREQFPDWVDGWTPELAESLTRPFDLEALAARLR